MAEGRDAAGVYGFHGKTLPRTFSSISNPKMGRRESSDTLADYAARSALAKKLRQAGGSKPARDNQGSAFFKVKKGSPSNRMPSDRFTNISATSYESEGSFADSDYGESDGGSNYSDEKSQGSSPYDRKSRGPKPPKRSLNSRRTADSRQSVTDTNGNTNFDFELDVYEGSLSKYSRGSEATTNDFEHMLDGSNATTGAIVAEFQSMKLLKNQEDLVGSSYNNLMSGNICAADFIEDDSDMSGDEAGDNPSSMPPPVKRTTKKVIVNNVPLGRSGHENRGSTNKFIEEKINEGMLPAKAQRLAMKKAQQSGISKSGRGKAPAFAGLKSNLSYENDFSPETLRTSLMRIDMEPQSGSKEIRKAMERGRAKQKKSGRSVREKKLSKRASSMSQKCIIS